MSQIQYMTQGVFDSRIESDYYYTDSWFDNYGQDDIDAVVIVEANDVRINQH